MTDAALVVVGSSLGGLHAVATLLGALPRDFRYPLAVAQHRGRDAGEGLLDHYQAATALRVVEADDKTPLVGATVYLAPSDYHLLIEPGRCALSTDAPVFHARPSIDVLFTSAADAYGPAVVAVALTGASRDGAEGLAYVRSRGGRVVVQDPASAESATLPRAALAALTLAGGAADKVLPLDGIGPWLARLHLHPARIPVATRRGGH